MVKILLVRLWIPFLPFFSAPFSCSKKMPGYSNCQWSLYLSVLNLNRLLFSAPKTTKPRLTVYFAFQTGDCPPGYNCPPGTGFPFSFPCMPGCFWDNSSVEGEGACKPCPPGYYCDSLAMLEPKPCPAVSCSFEVIWWKKLVCGSLFNTRALNAVLSWLCFAGLLLCQRQF